MARVIKADPLDVSTARARTPKASSRQVIEKEVYNAQKRAAEIKHEYDIRRDALLQEGKQRAAQAREEAQAQGAEDAFAEAAAEALAAFRARAERYSEARADIEALAREVVRKVLGNKTQLSAKAIDAILAKGLDVLRARRKLRVQLNETRVNALKKERPHLMRALRNEPDMIIEVSADVRDGFARVVTEVGGALSTEQRVLDELAQSIDVDERAVAPSPATGQMGSKEIVHPGKDAVGFEPTGDAFEAYSEEDDDLSEHTHRFSREELHTLDAPRAKKRRSSRESRERPSRRASVQVDPNRTLALDVERLRHELDSGES